MSTSSEEKPASTDLSLTERTPPLSRRKLITVFLTCSAIGFTSFLDQSTLAVALPIIGASLGASDQVSSIAAAYYITSTSFQLLYGRLSDIWSRKLILILGLAIFFLGSLGTSLAKNFSQVIIFRAITGIGGGSLVTVAQIIVGDVVSLRERGRWQGIVGSAIAVTYGIGPIIGGHLASRSSNSWRWIFRINLFTSAFTILMVLAFLPQKKVEGNWKTKLKTIDFFGTILSLAGSSLTIIGLSFGGEIFPWQSPQFIVIITLGGLIMAAFLLWEWKGAKLPLIPLSMFNSRMIKATSLVTFIGGWNFYVQVFFIPSFYNLAYGYSPSKAAAMLLPVTVVQTVSSTLGGLVVTWRGRYRESLIFGYTLWCVSLGLHSSLRPSTSLAQQLIYGFLLGFGSGLTFQPSLIAIQSAVSVEFMAVVTGVRSFIRDIAGTFGLAIAGSIINIMIRKALLNITANGQAVLSSQQINEIQKNPSLPRSKIDPVILENVDKIRSLVVSAYFEGFRRVFYLGTALGFVAIVTTIFFIPQVELSAEENNETNLSREQSTEISNEKFSISKNL
ncbi:putative mfs drug transporter [Erysiphe necator]|uniref:Putative mfs drug transporter n=1 Tax=Uncinula necator TaxID=52586 RepID=A0A0B1P735_UNCNE|nr:putative mfs drug transporter [Erysiphe necator]